MTLAESSRLDTMQIDDTATDTPWTTAAHSLARDVGIVLQDPSSTDDVHPLTTAASLEDLCLRSQQLCSQLPAQLLLDTITPRFLRGLQSICKALLQLSATVLCDPAVALQLLTAGTYPTAADQLKAGVKQLCSLLVDALKAATTDHEDSQQALLPDLLPAVQAAVPQLCHMALAQAAYTSGLPPPQKNISNSQIPKELRSMAVLNLSWGNLCKLLLETPARHRLDVLQPQQLRQALQCALQQLVLAVQGNQPPEKREVLARFWLQNAQRLVTVAGQAEAQAAMQLLVETTVDVFAYALRDDIDIHSFLEQQLQPRLITCLAVLLSCTPDDLAATQIRIDCLLELPSSHKADESTYHQKQAVQAILLAVLDVMQHLPAMQAAIVHVCCQQLLLWAIRTAGGVLCSTVVSTGQAGSALLQHVLQCCLLCAVGCLGVLQPEQHQELLATIIEAGLDRHPLVAFIAQQLLAELLSCSSADVVQEQLAGLSELLAAAAACCAVPGCATAMASEAEALVDTMVAILQAQDDVFISSWVEQNILSAAPFCSSTGWLDTGSCALLSLQCSMLLRLWPAAEQISQPLLEDSLNQIWLTAQQVSELLDPHHWRQQQQQSSLSSGATCEQMLYLHQVTWQLEAMQALMHVLTAKQNAQQSASSSAQGPGTEAPSSLIQGCIAFASEVLNTVVSTSQQTSSNGSPSTAAAATVAIAVHQNCITAALKVLAAAEHIAEAPESTDKLLQLLQAAARQHEGCQALVAAVVGKIRISQEHPRHEELFQLLLSSSHWPVRHAATAGLILHLQYNNFAKTGIPRMLPDSMKVGPSEAKPEAIEVIKSYLHRRPDTLAQSAYDNSFQQLAAQHSSLLSSSNSSATNDNSSSSALWSCKCIAEQLVQLDELVAGCGCPGDNGTSAVETGGAALQQLLNLATTVGGSLDSLEQALCRAEAEVQQLMSAATAAAQGQQLSGSEVLVISRKGSSMVGSCASMCSRLRALQDKLSCLKG